MMEFCSLSSGSSGNCHYIGTEKSKILVDAGLSGIQAKRLMDGIDRNIEDIDAILVTHEHMDHISGVGVLSRRYDLPIYANEKTWEAMKDSIGKIEDKNRKIFKTNEEFALKDFGIKPISIYHDANDPVGYILEKGNKKISVLTDTGKLDNNIISSMRGSDIYLIESNHDIQMLRNGNYPYYLQERIRSDFGHLSNDITANALKKMVRAEGEIVLLGHLSKDNNTPKTAFNETAFSLMELGIDIKKDVKLALTHRNKQTDLYSI